MTIVDHGLQHLLGLRLGVLRAATDCTNNGITARHDHLHLVAIQDHRAPTANGEVPTVRVPRECRPHVVTDATTAVVLTVRRFARSDVFHLAPATLNGATWTPEPGSHMAGGNYATTSDSRLGLLLRNLGLSTGYVALSVHDRVEH